MQGARHGFISGKQDVKVAEKALAQHSWVHRFVNIVVYYFELFWTLAQTALSQYIA